MDSSALTDDMIKSGWDKKSPARKVCMRIVLAKQCASTLVPSNRTDKCVHCRKRTKLFGCHWPSSRGWSLRVQTQVLITGQLWYLRRLPGADYLIASQQSCLCVAGSKAISESGQSDTKKSRFSLNFLRASLLSPKGSSAKSDSLFRASAQSAPETSQPSAALSDSDSTGMHGADDSTLTAQSYSPLGQGAAAFTPPSPSILAIDKQLLAINLPNAEVDTDAWPNQSTADQQAPNPPRSPLRALSSNSPTRRSLSSFNRSTLREISPGKALPLPLPSKSSPVTDQHSLQAQSQAYSHRPFAETRASRVSRQLQHQHSPLPPNALVAYSSDDDDDNSDYHGNIDATESECSFTSFSQRVRDNLCLSSGDNLALLAQPRTSQHLAN